MCGASNAVVLSFGLWEIVTRIFDCVRSRSQAKTMFTVRRDWPLLWRLTINNVDKSKMVDDQFHWRIEESCEKIRQADRSSSPLNITYLRTIQYIFKPIVERSRSPHNM